MPCSLPLRADGRRSVPGTRWTAEEGPGEASRRPIARGTRDAATGRPRRASDHGTRRDEKKQAKAKVGIGESSRKVHLTTRQHVDSWLLASKISRTYHSKGKPWFTSLPRRLDLPMQAHPLSVSGLAKRSTLSSTGQRAGAPEDLWLCAQTNENSRLRGNLRANDKETVSKWIKQPFARKSAY